MLSNRLERCIYHNVMLFLAFMATVFTVFIVVFIIGYVLIRAIPHVSWELLSTKPSYINETHEDDSKKGRGRQIKKAAHLPPSENQ